MIRKSISGSSWIALLAGAVPLAAMTGCGGGPAASSSGGGQGGSTTTVTTTMTTTSTGTGGQGGGTMTMECKDEYKPVPYAGGFALYHVNFGEFGPNGCAYSSFSGWKYLGENLDGQDGTNGKNCMPVPNASPDTLQDGEGGVDNAFGHFAIPVASTYVQLSGQTNSGYASGEATLVLLADKLDQAKSGDTILLKIYLTAPLVGADGMPASPKLDGKDVYSADDAWLDVDAPKLTAMATFKDGKLTASVDLLPLPFSVKIGDKRFAQNILVHKAHLVLPLSADLSRVEKGGISGFVDPAEFFDDVQTVTGSYLNELCMNSTVLGLKDQIAAAQDIRTDLQPDLPCDAISFGMEIDAVAAGISGKTTVTHLTNPCTM